MRRLFVATGIGMLSVMLGIPAVTWAQDDGKPPRQEEPKAEPKVEPKHQEPKPERQEDVKPPKHEVQQRPEDARQGHPEQGHEEHAARPAGRGGHIPDDKFREHFGRQHTVVIRRPVIVEGRPRFQFSGYWFEIADPWPVGWAYTDECYVDYVDGEYFLFDVLHPGVRIALFVAM